MSDSHAQDEQPALPERARGVPAVCPDRCIRVALRSLHASRFSRPSRPPGGILHHRHGHSFPWLNTSTPCTG
ncbi:hypothetical protein GFL09_12250 [Pseudomonas stutzeri]|nr:hypothetical protein [Stutzerimonas stutzeri]